MTAWRFCGAYLPAIRKPYDNGEWFDEATAKERYVTYGTTLACVPEGDPDTGFVPFYLSVGTGKNPSFWAYTIMAPGVVTSSVWWHNIDGRLFAEIAEIYQYPPSDQIPAANARFSLMRAEARNRPDGTGSMMISIKGDPEVTRFDRSDIPLEPLWRDVPAWGHWDDLIKNPPVPTP